MQSYVHVLILLPAKLIPKSHLTFLVDETLNLLDLGDLEFLRALCF